MRFVCDRCKSKYSISDEKVRGKILKIRCKRCNHIIEVRDPVAAKSAAPSPPALGAALTPASPPARRPSDVPEEHTQISSPGLLDELKRTAANLALQPSAEPVLSEWYVAISDEPTGPLTREEVRGHIAAGRVNSESLAWREGFDDWRPIREVADLKDLLRGSRALAAVAAPPRGRTTNPAPARRPESGLAEVIPLRPQADTTPAPPRPLQELGRPSLQRVEAPDHSPPPPTPFGAQQGGHVAVPLRGREVGRLGARPQTGSVAVPVPTPGQPAMPPPTPADAAPNLSALAGSPATPAPPGPGLDTSLAGLVSAAPPAFDAGDKRRMALILLICGAVVFGVVGAVVVVKLSSGGPEPVATGPGDGPRRPGNLVDSVPTNPGGGNPGIKGLLGTPEETPDETPDEVVDPGTPIKGAGIRGGGGPRPAGGGKGKNLTAEEQRILDEAKALGGGSSGPVAGKAKAGGSEGGGSAPRGQPLTGEKVRSTVGKNMGSIQRCYEREMRGAKMQRDLRVLVRMRIGTSGRVRSARVGTGTVRGSALGNCIEGAVRRWVFPSATGESNVEIPIVLTPRR